MTQPALVEVVSDSANDVQLPEFTTQRRTSVDALFESFSSAGNSNSIS